MDANNGIETVGVPLVPVVGGGVSATGGGEADLGEGVEGSDDWGV